MFKWTFAAAVVAFPEGVTICSFVPPLHAKTPLYLYKAKAGVLKLFKGHFLSFIVVVDS